MRRVFCYNCKVQKIKDKGKNWRKYLKINTYICTQCGVSFQHIRKRKTCSRHCRTVACVLIRPYQNGSRKPVWYYNKYQHKDVMLESSWEYAVAEYLDMHNIKWTRPEPIRWIDDKGANRLYFPDFCLVEHNTYLDPKNPYCLAKDKEKLEKISKEINIIYGSVDYIISFIKQNIL